MVVHVLVCFPFHPHTHLSSMVGFDPSPIHLSRFHSIAMPGGTMSLDVMPWMGGHSRDVSLFENSNPPMLLPPNTHAQSTVGDPSDVWCRWIRRSSTASDTCGSYVPIRFPFVCPFGVHVPERMDGGRGASSPFEKILPWFLSLPRWVRQPVEGVSGDGGASCCVTNGIWW